MGTTELWRAWPPRLPDQPILYPVLNEDYAVRIAREWNVPHSGVGYVTRFRVEPTPVVGLIEVVHEFR